MLEIRIVYILFLLHSCSSLNPNDFCKVIGKEVVGKYDHNNKYEIALRSVNCSERNAPFITSCDKEICARSKIKCREYLSKENHLKVAMERSFVHITIMSNKQISHSTRLEAEYFRFKKRIGNCPKTPYKWQPNDVCIRQRNCFKFQERSLIERFFGIRKSRQTLKRIICPCYGKHTYVCGNSINYCSVNKEACDLFKYKVINPWRQIKLDHRLHGIKECNFPVLINNKIFHFNF